MEVYHFHHETGEYVASSTAHIDPVALTPVMPAYATSVAPPNPEDGKAIVIDEDTGEWVLQNDYRGQDYWDTSTREYLGEVTFIGELPDGTSLTEPDVPLAEAKEEKLKALQAEKVRIRDGGITVDGVLYDSDEAAQSAYTRVATFVFSSDPDAVIQDWKASTGVWVTMTKDLLETLVAAGYANELAAFSWQKAREVEVEAATTVEELDLISETYA